MEGRKPLNKIAIFSTSIIAVGMITLFFINKHIGKMTQAPEYNITDLYLYMEEEDLQELYSRDPLEDEKMRGYARISLGDENLKPVEVRFRGHSTLYLPKKSFNLQFEKGQYFLFGSDRMNLLASYSDPTLMREKISMDMFKELSLLAPKSEYFNLYINDIYEGLYVHTERIDENILKHAKLNEKGTLVRDRFTTNLHKEEIYRGSVFGYDIASVEDPETLLMENFEYRGKPNWEKVIELSEWVYNTPAGDDYYTGFKERVELEGFVDWLAIHLLIGDIDAFADDHWLYLDHEDPNAKWRIIPWDKDLSFGITYRPDEYVDNDYFAYEYDIYKHGYRDNDLIAKFLETPQLREILFQRMDYLMREIFPLEYFVEKTQMIEKRIGKSANTMPGKKALILNKQNHHGELGHRDACIEALLDFVELRYEFLRREMKPIEESIYTATVDLSPYSKGDTVLFTDSKGWTIAKLQLDKIKKAGKLTISVEVKKDIRGINRIWKVVPESTDVSGDLTLYYRNEVFVFGKENWYETKEAIGDQWNLSIGRYKEGNIEFLPSKVNPYSNKVTSKLNIDKMQELVISY